MSSDDLEALVARALATAGLEILDLSVHGATVRLPGGPEHDLGFANLRRLLAASPPERAEAVVDRFVGRWVERARAPRSEAEAPRQLFPRLLSPGTSGPGLAAPWVEPLAGGSLLLGLAVDDFDAVKLVTLLDFPRWRLSLAEAKSLAMRNLEASSAKLGEALIARSDPSAPFEVSEGDGYDAARLLLVHRWAPQARGVLALVPTRDLLLAVPVLGPAWWRAAMAEAMARLAWAQEAFQALPYPLSPHLFWRSEGMLERLPVTRTEEGQIAVHMPETVAAVALGEDA